MSELAAGFARSVAAHPRRVAVEGPDGRAVTYEELDARATGIAGALDAAGVGEGDRVGLRAPKTVDAVAGILGTLKLGAAYVPVDADGPAARADAVLEDAAVAAVIGEAGRIEPVHAGRATPSSQGLAAILYTSGSTGRPKGVTITDEGAAAFVRWCSGTFGPTPDDRFASHAPFHFDLSVLDVFVSLGHGATLVLLDETLGRLPDRLPAWISDRRVTVWYSTPTVLALMARHGDMGAHPCPDLRLVLFAGEVFPPRSLAAVRRAWPAPRYFNLYGPTETNVCTYFEIPADAAPDRDAPWPIGRACSHLRVELRPSPNAPGDAGELYVAGPSVTPGYWGRPDLDADAFVTDADGARWYATGDLARADGDGDLVFLGRGDRMVKRRGYRIEPGEIEAALCGHPDVAEAAVVARYDGPDEAAVTLTAYVVWTGAAKPSTIRLRATCAERLPSWMMPDRFHFVDALPKTSTHKTDYRRLAAAPA